MTPVIKTKAIQPGCEKEIGGTAGDVLKEVVPWVLSG
jgi:hypothetical protein